MINMDNRDDIRTLLDQQNWEDIIPRLLRYALYKIRYYKPHQVAGEEVLAGKTAEDYVMDAIMKVYRGERRWDPDQMPDLQYYLIGVLRSDMGHSAVGLENRCVAYIENLPEYRQHAFLKDNPDQENLGEDEFIAGFLEYIKDHLQLTECVKHILAGLKPRQIAQQMNLSASAIYNMRKVLRRRLQEYLSKGDTAE
jgi:DNA-directed RNA polymerase specialized sigma24 family protein